MADKLEIEISLKNAADTEKQLKKIKDGVEDTGKAAKKSESFFQKLEQNVKKNWLAMGAAVVVFKKQFGGLIQSYVRQEQAERQLAARLKSTGNAVGLTAKELTKMATELQKVTTFGDEAIMEMQSLLLTFTKIGKETFPEATEAVLNMSTAFGQDLRSSAIQLGKALNEPVEGVSALRRVGVQLSDEQENQIKQYVKMNDVAAAQGIILQELATQTGGAARAAAEGTGQIEQFKNIWGDVQEVLGKIIVPVITKVLGLFTKMPDSLKVATVAISTFIPLLIGLKIAFAGTALAMGPVGIALTALGAAGAGILLFLNKGTGDLKTFDNALNHLGETTKKDILLRKDSYDSLKRYIDETKRGLLGTEKNVTALRDEVNALILAGGEKKKLKETTKKLNEEIETMNYFIATLTVAEEYLVKVTPKLTAEQIKAKDAAEKRKNETEKLNAVLDDLKKVEESTPKAQKRHMESMLAAAVATGKSKDEIKLLEKAISDFDKQIADSEKKVDDHTKKITEAEAAAQGLKGVFGEIGGTDGALASAILNMVEIGNVSEVAGAQAQTAGEKAEAAWTKVLGVIGLVKAALNEISFMFEFFAEVAGDEGNSKAERVLTAISKILTSMATGSPWKVIKAIRDVVMGGREDAREADIDAYMEANPGASRKDAESAIGEGGQNSYDQMQKEDTAKRVIAGIASGGASEVGRLIGKGISKIRGRATGGAVSGNEPYMVGERGPEMFLPSQNGSIIPSHNVTNNKGMTFNNVTIKADNPEQFFDQLQRYQRQHGVLA